MRATGLAASVLMTALLTMTACDSSTKPQTQQPEQGAAPYGPPAAGFCEGVLTRAAIDGDPAHVWKAAEQLAEGQVVCNLSRADADAEFYEDHPVVYVDVFVRVTGTPEAARDDFDQAIRSSEKEAAGSGPEGLGGADRSPVDGWWDRGTRYEATHNLGPDLNLLNARLVAQGANAYVNVSVRGGPFTEADREAESDELTRAMDELATAVRDELPQTAEGS